MAEIERLKAENKALQDSVKSYEGHYSKLQSDYDKLTGSCSAFKEAAKFAKPDFSSQLLLKAFSGQDASYPVKDFLAQFERVAKTGKWGPEEILLVAENKLTGPAKAALHANADIVTSAEPLPLLRNILEERFADRNPDYYLRELNGASQKGEESVLAFGDRVTELGHRAVPSSINHTASEATWTNKHRDALILAAYLNGLQGEPGLQLQYNPPDSMVIARQRAAIIERVQKEKNPSTNIKSITPEIRQKGGSEAQPRERSYRDPKQYPNFSGRNFQSREFYSRNSAPNYNQNFSRPRAPLPRPQMQGFNRYKVINPARPQQSRIPNPPPWIRVPYSSLPSQDVPRCYQCGRVDHIKRYCPDIQRQPKPTDNDYHIRFPRSPTSQRNIRIPKNGEGGDRRGK